MDAHDLVWSGIASRSRRVRASTTTAGKRNNQNPDTGTSSTLMIVNASSSQPRAAGSTPILRSAHQASCPRSSTPQPAATYQNAAARAANGRAGLDSVENSVLDDRGQSRCVKYRGAREMDHADRDQRRTGQRAARPHRSECGGALARSAAGIIGWPRTRAQPAAGARPVRPRTARPNGGLGPVPGRPLRGGRAGPGSSPRRCAPSG